MSKFPKGLVHDFPQKYENSSQSHFLWKIPTHDFNNVLNEKKEVSKVQKCHFKLDISSESHFLWKRPRHNV